MAELPFYQVLDYQEMFRNTIIRRQLDLVQNTSIKPLSYFNTLPSGDIVSDQEFDTFLSDQMFQEEFEFTVADDISIGKTTLRNSLGKREALHFQFGGQATKHGAQGKLKKLHTFHLGDRNVIPCSTDDPYLHEAIEKESEAVSRASIITESSNALFQSLRIIDTNQQLATTLPTELDSPPGVQNRKPSLGVEIGLTGDTPHFGTFQKSQTMNHNINLMTPNDQTFVIEETNEEDQGIGSAHNEREVTNKNSRGRSKSNESQLENTSKRSNKRDSRGISLDVKRKLMDVAKEGQSSEEMKISTHTQGQSSKLQAAQQDNQPFESSSSPSSKRPNMSFSQNRTEDKSLPLTPLDFDSELMPQLENLKKMKRMESDKEKEISLTSSVKGVQLGKSGNSELSTYQDKNIPSVEKIGGNFHSLTEKGDNSPSSVVDQRISATFTNTLEKSISEIDQKIKEVKLKTKMLDLTRMKANADSQVLNTSFGKEPRTGINLEAIQEYIQSSSKTSTLKNTPKRKGDNSSPDTKPFFQTNSKFSPGNVGLFSTQVNTLYQDV